MSVRDALQPRREVLPAVLCAVLLFVAFAPASLVVPSFCALVPFIWSLERVVAARRAGAPEDARTGTASRLRDFLHGYWYGVWANGIVLYWIFVALFHFTPLSLAGYLAAVLIVLAPMWGIASWVFLRVRTRTTIPVWIAFPLIWTAVEFLQAHLGDVNFPWLGMGTSLTRLPILVQWADIAGARGVTMWLAWANVMVFLALKEKARADRALSLLAATLVIALAYGAWREKTIVMRPVTTVAVIQPNVGFKEKLAEREKDTLALQLLALTRRADSIPDVRLVAWPEAALEGYFLNKPEWAGWISTLSRSSGIPILVGGLDAELRNDGTWEPFNTAFLFDSAGSYTSQPVYHKTYLVPIVERVPFLNPRWFGELRWFGGFGKGRVFPVYRIREGGFGILVCYESAYEGLARDYRARGADFLVNITNDMWFGRTVAPYQHASHLVMRAIETRIGIARAANTGISQFIDPFGYTHLSTPLVVQRVEASPVLTTDVHTLYVRFGDWVALVAAAGAIACLTASYLRKDIQGVTA